MPTVDENLEFWIKFGAGKSLKFIPIHQIARSLEPDKSLTFLFFYAFSGCDTASSLSGKDKKRFFDTWISMDETTLVFKKLSSIATPDGVFKLLELFVVRLYSNICNTKELNDK